MSLTELSIKRPSLVIVVFIALGFFGLVSYSSLGYELVPRFQSTYVILNTVYPGASPSEVENSVTRKLEDALSSLENVKAMRAVSMENVSLIIIEFNSGTNTDIAVQDANRKIAAIMSTLPDEVQDPTITKLDPNEAPVMTLSLNSNLEPGEFFDIVDNQIRPRLSGVPGVAQIVVVGGQEREIRINMNADKLRAYGLSPLQVVQAVKASNLDFPTGRVRSQENQVLIRLAGKLQNLDELRNLILRSDGNGSNIQLRDVAEVEDGLTELTGVNRLRGRTALGILVNKQTDANAVAVTALIRAQLEKITQQYGNIGFTVEIANDNSQFTLEAAEAVIHDIGLAILLVALVMLVFLHSLRNAIIVMVAIPASLISTFIAMALFDYTLNLMTLLGLSLVIGILVDDSIVVLENIYRHMEMGKNRVRASLDGRDEIGLTAISITLVDVVVFLPITLADGFVVMILKQFAVVVVVSALLSLLVSFTITPMLASRYSKLEVPNPRNLWGKFIIATERVINGLANSYQRILGWVLRHKLITMFAAVSMFFGSCSLIGGGYIGAEFISRGDRGQFIVYAELPRTATIEQTSRISLAVEQFLMEQQGVDNVFSNVGSSNSFFGRSELPYKSEINVRLVPAEQRGGTTTNVFAAQMKLKLEEHFPGVKFQAADVNFFGSADLAPIQVILSGPTLDSLMYYANQIRGFMDEIPGARESKISIEAGNPEVRVEIDRLKMAELGLSMDVVGATLQTAFAGNDDSRYREGTEEYDINIRLDEADRQDAASLAGVAFVNNRGQSIRLGQFAEITEASGPSALERQNRTTSVTITCGVVGVPEGNVGAAVAERIEGMGLPPSFKWEWEGNMKNQSEGFGTLGIALLTSILLVYFIMVALYDSFIYPFVVLFSIPLAFIGALLALALTMNSLSIFTILGMIMLVGLVAKNAILLVDFANQMKAEGMDTRAALLEAGRTRLRPILMTTVAMVIGMLPIAIAGGAGAEWKNGLGWALIGGLTSSMFLTLLVVPVMYYAVDRLKDKVTGKRNRGGPTLEELIEEEPDMEIAARYAHLHNGNHDHSHHNGNTNGHATDAFPEFSKHS